MRPTGFVAGIATVTSLATLLISCAGSEPAGRAVEAQSVSLVPAELPAPLRVGERRIVVGDDSIDVALVLPRGYVGQPGRVLVALPPGPQTLELTTRVVASTWIEAARRGWVVVSPAAVGDELWFEADRTRITAFLDAVAELFPAMGGFDLVGISNGGTSAFRFAVEQPTYFRTITTAPGFARRDAFDDLELIAEAGTPVTNFVGASDTQWVEAGGRTVAALRDAGGRAVQNVVAGEGHVIQTYADGRVYLDTIEAALG